MGFSKADSERQVDSTLSGREESEEEVHLQPHSLVLGTKVTMSADKGHNFISWYVLLFEFLEKDRERGVCGPIHAPACGLFPPRMDVDGTRTLCNLCGVREVFNMGEETPCSKNLCPDCKWQWISDDKDDVIESVSTATMTARAPML